MPDVGTLNITIKSDAEQAAQGLKELAGALSDVQKAAPNGLNLAGISGPLNKFAKAVKDNSKPLANIGTFLNAITNYKNAFKKIEDIKFNSEPITKLKEAIGDGIKIGQAGTQINNLRNALVGEWNTNNAYQAGIALSAIAEGAKNVSDAKLAATAKNVSAVAKALDEYATAAEHVKSAVGESAWNGQDMVGGGAGMEANAIGANVSEGMAEGIRDKQDAVESASSELANSAVINTLKTELDVHSPSEVTHEIGVNAGLGLAQGLEDTKSTVQSVAEEMAETLYTTLNVKAIMDTPLEYMRDIYKTPTKSMDEYKNAVGAVLPKVQELSSEEMMMAAHGRMAKEAIDGIISSLDQKISYKGLSEFVNAMTGVSGKKNGAGLINESTTMLGSLTAEQSALKDTQEEIERTTEAQIKLNDAGQAVAGAVRIFDEAAGAYKEIYMDTSKAADALEKAINLATVPASGKNGVFANVAEEVAYLKQKIDDEIASQQQWISINEAAAKQLQYGGPRSKDELQFDLKHSEEGYYASLEAEQQYKDALVELSGYMNTYIANMEQASSTTNTQAESTKAVAEATNQASEAIEELKDVQEEASRTTLSFSKAWDGLKSGITRMFPTLTSLLKRFKSMMIMRSLRYVIRSLSKGFSEGVQNVYQYSKAVGTSFAPAMDQAATAMQQLKNSIGAAVAPVIQALIPVLQTVVNWVISGINYLNQFFALLNGQSTWTRALPEAAEAFEKNTKAAKGSSKAMKDLLADWDELNIIQSNSNSGGGSGTGKTAEEYKNMFEEVSRFDDGIKRLVRGIEDQFGDILGFVKKIGLAVLGWKLSNAFTGALGTIGALVGSSLVIGLTFDISTIFTKQFLATGEKGWLVGDLLATLVGGTLAKKMLGNVLGGSLAKLAIPLAFAVSAGATIKALIQDTDVSVLSEKSILSAIAGGIEGGAAIGTALFSLGEYAAGTSAVAGIGGALFTFGVAIGLKAIATKLDVGELTPEVIGANFLSAGAIGGGLFITELALGGGVVSALTLGGGAAILALGALFAIEALISKEPAKVEWGEYKATKAEIEEFINNKLYEEPPTATIKKINTVIDKLPEVKGSLSSDISSVVGTIDALTVGILTTPEDLKSDIDQLISDFNNASEQYQNTLKVALSLAPVTGEGGKDKTSEILKNSSGRWSALNEIMADLGSQLADAYKIAYDARLQGNIDKAAEETIKEISEMMNRVTTAIATGQSKARAGNAIRMQIENLSKETLDGILESYKAQRNALIEELKNVRKESAEGILAQQYAFEELAAYALQDANGNTGDATYKYYMKLAQRAKDDYEALIATLDNDVEEAADNLADSETMKKLRDFMISSITNTLNENDIDAALASAGYDADKLGEYLVKILSGGDIDKQRSEVQELFDSLLSDLVGEDNYETFKSAIESNVLSYSDLFSDKFISSIADRLGITGENRDAWNKYVSELLGKDVKTPGLDNTELDSSVKDAKSAIADLTSYISGKMSELTGQGFDVKAIFKGSVATLPVELRASGGFVKSGDLVMANENGNIEMMGKMGNQPVIANNQQIVSGISQGVSQANTDVVSELRAMANMMQKMLQKEFVARAVPSSAWGSHNAQSNAAYEKVTG